MDNAIIIRRATSSDQAAISGVLREAGILHDAFDQSAESFILAESPTEQGTEIAATVGFEKYGHLGLLRSCVIRKKAWNADNTIELLGLILAHACDSGVQTIYLVTQSPALFIHMGFEQLERTNIPEELQHSRHFMEQSKHAIAMRKVLP